MSENFFEGPQVFLTTTVELIGAFSSNLRGCWKHNFWRKRRPFQWKKKHLTSFNSYCRRWKTSRNNLQGSTSHSYQYCIRYRWTFLGPKMLLKTQILEKKRQPFQWKKLLDRFFACYRAWKTQGTIYNCP